MDYEQLNRISVDIREIHNTSRAVNMSALNATLVARCAGDARGFHAVAGELRGFSHRLSLDMDVILSHINLLAVSVSSGYKNGHRRRLFEATRSVTEAVTALDGAIEACTHKQQAATAEFHQLVETIRSGIGSAKRLCSTGRALAHFAMIESSYSEKAASQLKVVSANVESSITSIYDGLKSIESKLS